MSPESTKFVALAFLPPPNVLAMTLPNASNAALISGDGPLLLAGDPLVVDVRAAAVEDELSSTQSEPGQPLAAPDSRPTQKVLASPPIPSAVVLPLASRSSYVAGAPSL